MAQLKEKEKKIKMECGMKFECQDGEKIIILEQSKSWTKILNGNGKLLKITTDELLGRLYGFTPARHE